MNPAKSYSKIILLTIGILVIGNLSSCVQKESSKSIEESSKSIEESSKRIKVGISVTPDIFNPTVKFYLRTSDGDKISNWKLVDTKSIEEKDRGRAAVYSQYYEFTKTSFIEIKAIVSHPNYRDCDTGAIRFDYNSQGGVRFNDGPCCMMYANYKK